MRARLEFRCQPTARVPVGLRTCGQSWSTALRGNDVRLTAARGGCLGRPGRSMDVPALSSLAKAPWLLQRWTDLSQHRALCNKLPPIPAELLCAWASGLLEALGRRFDLCCWVGLLPAILLLHQSHTRPCIQLHFFRLPIQKRSKLTCVTPGTPYDSSNFTWFDMRNFPVDSNSWTAFINCCSFSECK